MHSSQEGQSFSNTMNARAGSKARPLVERFIKCSKRLLYSCKTTEGGRTRPSVGCPQIVSDKPQ